MQTPFMARADTWNVMLLPPPVGMRPKVSRPALMLSMTCRYAPEVIISPVPAKKGKKIGRLVVWSFGRLGNIVQGGSKFFTLHSSLFT